MAMRVKMPKEPPAPGEGIRQGSIRKLSLLVSIVAIITVAAAAGAWYFSASNIKRPEPECVVHGDPGYYYLQFEKELSDGNWTLRSVCNLAHITLDQVSLSITRLNGTPADPMTMVHLSSLTQSNWNRYLVLYVKVGGEDYVRLGARVIVDASQYPPGYRYAFSSPSMILCTGSF